METVAPRLLVSVPTPINGSINCHLAMWLQSLTAQCSDWHVVWEILQAWPVAHTRNEQFRNFLKNDDVDYLLTIDNDAVPDMRGLHLLMDAIQRDDVDAVGGWSVQYSDDVPQPCIQRYYDDRPGGPDWKALEKGGLVELSQGGLGAHCLMVKKATVQKFFDEKVVWFKDQLRDGSLERYHIEQLLHAYDPADLPVDEQFQRGLGLYRDIARWLKERDDANLEHFGARFTGQDSWFCKRCHDLDLRLWCDTRVFWGHIKNYDIRKVFLKRQQSITAQRRKPDASLAKVLRDHWGNTSHSAGAEYLLRLASECQELPEDQMVLECGSGLTTEVIASIVGHDRFISLEQDKKWMEDTRSRAASLNGRIIESPLKDYGEYEWYTPAEGDDPWRLKGKKIGLVVCDGPRGNNVRSRAGAMPQLRNWLAPSYTILMDDCHRAPNRLLADVWAEEYGLKHAFVEDGDKVFAALVKEEES